MNNPLLQIGLDVLAHARHATLGFLEDIPADKMCYQPFPGANHALWVVGHLAMTDDYIRAELGGVARQCPEAWAQLFGPGSKPTGQTGDYPRHTEVLDKLKTCRETLVSWMRSLTPEQLTAPLEGDWKKFAPHRAGLMASLAWHEGLHAGQVTVVRKSLGMVPKFF